MSEDDEKMRSGEAAQGEEQAGKDEEVVEEVDKKEAEEEKEEEEEQAEKKGRKKSKKDKKEAGMETKGDEACRCFVPGLKVVCATCGKEASAHGCTAKYEELVLSFEEALQKTVSAIEAAHRDLRRETTDKKEEGEKDEKDISSVSLDALLHSLETKFSETLNAVLGPEIASMREAEARARRAEKRKNILAELVATEEEYLNDMNTLMEVWKPVASTSGLFDGKQIAQIFKGVPHIVYLSKDLCEQLREVQAKPLREQNLGAMMLKKVPFMKLYVDQCCEVPKITELLHSMMNRPQYLEFQSVC